MEKFSWLSERGSQVIINHLQDGIYVIEEGALVYVNPPLAKILGYKVSELIGRAFIGLVATEDRPIALERYRARLSGEDVPMQYHYCPVKIKIDSIGCAAPLRTFCSLHPETLAARASSRTG